MGIEEVRPCAPGYEMEAGDLPGWGTGGIGGRISADTSLVCAGLCSAKTNCLSFEWSPTQKKCNLNTEAHPTGRPYRDFDFCSRLPEVYIEGRLDNAEYTGSPTFSTEAEVTDACNALDRCRGMWQQRGSNVWQMLFDGSRSWARGAPNGTVLSVKVRVSKVAPVLPPPAGAYVEGRLDNAEYTGSPTFSTENEVAAACEALDRCRGMWQQRGSNVWQMLFDGSRSWARGVPNGTVLSVKIRVSKVAPVVPETCAPGYDLEAGDLPGWG